MTRGMAPSTDMPTPPGRIGDDAPGIGSAERPKDARRRAAHRRRLMRILLDARHDGGEFCRSHFERFRGALECIKQRAHAVQRGARIGKRSSDQFQEPQRALERHAELGPALRGLAGTLDAATMRRLNAAVDVDRQAPADVVAAWLASR